MAHDHDSHAPAPKVVEQKDEQQEKLLKSNSGFRWFTPKPNEFYALDDFGPFSKIISNNPGIVIWDGKGNSPTTIAGYNYPPFRGDALPVDDDSIGKKGLMFLNPLQKIRLQRIQYFKDLPYGEYKGDMEGALKFGEKGHERIIIKKDNFTNHVRFRQLHPYVTVVTSKDNVRFFIIRRILVVCKNPQKAFNAMSDNETLSTCLNMSSEILRDFCDNIDSEKIYRETGDFREKYASMLSARLFGDPRNFMDGIYDKTGYIIEKDAIIDIIPENQVGKDLFEQDAKNALKTKVNALNVATSIADASVINNLTSAEEQRKLKLLAAEGIYDVEYVKDSAGVDTNVIKKITKKLDPALKAKYDAQKEMATGNLQVLTINEAGATQQSQMPTVLDINDYMKKNKVDPNPPSTTTTK